MKKSLSISVLIFLLALALTGCGSTDLPEALAGSWTCEPLASDGKTATEFYAMDINTDGSFSLYDTVGNPGISGKMELEKSSGDRQSKGIVRVSCGSDDFDPPLCWNMKEEDTLEYEILDGGKMRLGHNGVWLTFYDAYTHAVYEIRLADRSNPEYQWDMKQSGDGEVKIVTDTILDEDVGIWRLYDLTGTKPGDLTITMTYHSETETMYTVTFALTVNEDGTIHENDIDGDVDEAMTE